jgi:hypothetical protein
LLSPLHRCARKLRNAADQGNPRDQAEGKKRCKHAIFERARDEIIDSRGGLDRLRVPAFSIQIYWRD